VWDRWLAYRHSRDHLELMKTYAAQGKEPPPEVSQAARGPQYGPEWGPGPYGPYWLGRRAWRRFYRWGPYWQWRGVFVTGMVALGFWFAADWLAIPGTEDIFRLVAFILGLAFVANLVGAIFTTALFRDR